MCIFMEALFEGDTPLFGTQYSGGVETVRSTQRVGTQYAKSCYIVRRHLYLLLKGPIFIKKHNKRDIQSQIILNFSRARFARAFWGGHFSIYKVNITSKHQS